VTLATYRDLFAATASTAGALTGLLFVALSVAPRQRQEDGPPVIRQVRSAAALLAFSNALAISLYSLVPSTHVGYPAIVMAIIGITFTAAAIRSVRTSPASRRQKNGQVGLAVLLLVIFGTELGAGIASLADPKPGGTAIQFIAYAVVTSLIVGVARAWEFIGERDTGLVASLAVLASRPRQSPAGTTTPPAGASPPPPPGSGSPAAPPAATPNPADAPDGPAPAGPA
jgi:hypothetical protein